MIWNQVMAHLVGDYLLQNDWMAVNKKDRWWPCLLHVLFYMLPWIVGATFWWPITVPQLALIGLEHYIQDRTNVITWFMNHVGMKEFAKPPMAPWSIFVTDNIIHLLWITFILSVL